MWTELLTDEDAKLLTQCEQSYTQMKMQSYSLNVNRRRRKVIHSMWTELLADTDAKLLTQCEQSYSQMQMQSYSLNVNRVTCRHRCKVTHSMWTELLADVDAKLLNVNRVTRRHRCKVTCSMWTDTNNLTHLINRFYCNFQHEALINKWQNLTFYCCLQDSYVV